MPAKYRYPGKADFEGVSKEMKSHGIKTGEMSDVDASSLYREAKEGDLLGSTGANFSQFVQTSKMKMKNDEAAIFRMADDFSVYDTSGK
jgi:hypothetical protein|tara:strand:+ start:58 stop:324 length:267 start_codon:yes stop_codon:yes gene_type:complete